MTEQIGYGKEDFQALEKEDHFHQAIHCNGCFSCTDCCPMNIAIPKFFMVYNLMQLRPEVPSETIYRELLTSGDGPADCIRCGRCEDHCPNHLGIVGFLQDITEEFEDL